MEADHPDLNGFVVAVFDAAHRSVQKATDGLTDQQLYYRPSPDANSIAWLAWHLSRWKDKISSGITGEPEVWVDEGWSERFGMVAERTGLGDTPDQVAAFNVDRDLLFGYVDAAHRATLDRVSKMTPQHLERMVEYSPTNIRKASDALAGNIGDAVQHTGQINYLRGMITGYGWR